MRILQIHSSDHMGGGGGTIAMERLHLGLLGRGVDSRIVCGRKTTKADSSRNIPGGRWIGRAENLLHKVTREIGLNDVHHLSSFRVAAMDFAREADLIHIHGTHGFFNYLALPGLTRDKPALFTLHDMWPMTGHCAQSMDCDRWASGCGKCPNLAAHPAVKRDNTHLEWRLKRKVYRDSQIEFIVVSRTLSKMAERGLLAEHPVNYIPNAVDTSIYEPIDTHKCREVLGIESARYVLIFVALNLKDKGKGGNVLVHALNALPDALKKETCLVVFGDGGQSIQEQVGIHTLDLGYVRNDRLKAIAYGSADLCLLPTLAENLPLVLLESLACGTPMLASRVGGIPEVVRDGLTGRLTEPGNEQQFAEVLVELLDDESGRVAMARSCRELAMTEYDIQEHLNEHVNLYRSVLERY